MSIAAVVHKNGFSSFQPKQIFSFGTDTPRDQRQLAINPNDRYPRGLISCRNLASGYFASETAIREYTSSIRGNTAQKKALAKDVLCKPDLLQRWIDNINGLQRDMGLYRRTILSECSQHESTLNAQLVLEGLQQGSSFATRVYGQTQRSQRLLELMRSVQAGVKRCGADATLNEFVSLTDGFNANSQSSDRRGRSPVEIRPPKPGRVPVKP